MRRCAACCLVIGLLLPACSEPPDKERQQAEGALQAARAAGAETYAPAEFQEAQAALNNYDAAVAQRDYRQALNYALEARDRAYDAVKQAGNSKAEQRSRADRLASELETLVTNATTRLTAATGRPVGLTAERLRASRDAGRKTLQEARTRIAAQDYRGAADQLTPSVARLRQDLQAAETAAARRRR